MAGGVLGWLESAFTGEEAEDAKAQSMVDEIMREYQNVETPEFGPTNYETMGYAPMSSEWEGVQTDPMLRDRQLASMGALDEIIGAGGMTQTDEANLGRIQSQAATADRGRRDAIMQNAAMRGMGGGGNELVAQLQSSQAAANQQAQQGLDVSGMAQQRALAAISGQGQMAGQIRGQDFGEAGQRASNLDAIGQFNKANTMDTNRYNTDVRNRAIDETNRLKQQEFGNTMDVKAGKSGALGTGVGYYTGVADRKQRQKGAILGGAIKGGTAYATGGA